MFGIVGKPRAADRVLLVIDIKLNDPKFCEDIKKDNTAGKLDCQEVKFNLLLDTIW